MNGGAGHAEPDADNSCSSSTARSASPSTACSLTRTKIPSSHVVVPSARAAPGVIAVLTRWREQQSRVEVTMKDGARGLCIEIVAHYGRLTLDASD